MSSQLSTQFWGQSPVTYGDRHGLGFNRRTWNAGQTIGRAVKRWWKGRQAQSSSKREAKKSVVRRAKPLVQVAEQDGIGGSFTNFNYGRYKLTLPKSVLKTLCKNYTMTNNAGQLTTTPGVQNVADLNIMFTSADIATFPVMTGNTNAKIMCLGVRSEILFTNAANTTARLTMYDVVPRRDVSNATITGPTQAWVHGEADEGASGAYAFPGITPFSSKSFTELFRVVQKSNVLLAQGATHIHKTEYFPNKSIDYGVMHYGSIWKSLSAFTMVVWHGQVSDAVTGGAGASIGATKINYVVSKEYVTANLYQTTSNVSATNSLPTSFTGGENTISLGSGLVAPETTA